MTLIPDGEILFRYARPEAFPGGQKEIPKGVFEDRELSTDWEKFQKDPDSSFHVEEGKTRIISITIHDEIRNPCNPKRSGQIVQEWKQEIIHDPITDEKHGYQEGHSLIKGLKKKAVTDALIKHSQWRDANRN